MLNNIIFIHNTQIATHNVLNIIIFAHATTMQGLPTYLFVNGLRYMLMELVAPTDQVLAKR